MKKIYLSIALAGFSFSGLYAQIQMKPHTFGKVTQRAADKVKPSNLNSEKNLTWHENFVNGLAGQGTNGAWTTGNTNGDIWKHSMYTTSGEWSTGTPAFASTTANNGFMLFDADSVNFITSPTYNNFDGDLISPVIDFSGEPSVQLVMEQEFRYCCAGSLDISVSVSNDGGASYGNPYPLAGSVATNAGSGTHTVTANITADAANQANVRLKFSWNGTASGNSHYYWVIDDISFETAADNDIVAQDPYWGTDGLPYYQIPTTQVAPIDFSAFAFNNGGIAQTGVTLGVAVDMGATFTGSSASVTIAPGATDSLGLTSQWTPAASVNSHQVLWGITQNETDEVPANNLLDTLNIEITDYIYARDNGVIDGGTFNSGDGYEVGNLFDIWTDQTCTAVDVQLDDGTTVGALLYAKIYSIDPATGDFVFEQQSDYHTVVASDLTSVLTLELISPLLMTNTNLTYLAVIATDGDGGLTDDIITGTAGDSEAQTTFYYDATDATWYYTTSTPMVRLNFDPSNALSENENAFGVKLYPNPATDAVSVDYNLGNASDVTIIMTDLSGKTIATVNETANAGINTVSLNTKALSAGIYNVVISTDNGTVTEKFIKK